MDGTVVFEDMLEAAIGEYDAQQSAYDELLSRHGLTREAVARAGEGRYLAPGRRVLLAAAKDAADDAPRPAESRVPAAVPPHAVPV